MAEDDENKAEPGFASHWLTIQQRLFPEWEREMERRDLEELERREAEAAAALVCLVERFDDRAWKPWMVYAAGSGLRAIAAPARLNGVENVGGVRSGVAVYTRLETAADLAEAHRAARAEVQKLSVAARSGF